MRALTGKLLQLRRAIAALVKDFRPVWAEQQPIVRDAIIEQFRGSHQQIARATRLWRRRKGYSPDAPPLQASRTLFRSLANKKSPGAINNQFRKTMEIGTSLPQAAPNYFGANVAVRHKSDKQKDSGKGRKSKTILYRIRIPARPFFPDTSSDRFQSRLTNHLEGFLNRYIIRAMAEKESE